MEDLCFDPAVEGLPGGKPGRPSALGACRPVAAGDLFLEKDSQHL
jgi:hypothetical protein